MTNLPAPTQIHYEDDSVSEKVNGKSISCDVKLDTINNKNKDKYNIFLSSDIYNLLDPNKMNEEK